MLPITASGVSGIGQSATGLLEGSWAFGFFRDGERNQDAVILCSLPGRPTQGANSSQGFNDPNGVYPRYINEPDTNRLAVNDPDKPHPSLAMNADTRVTGIQAYNSEWDQPASTYAAVYPFNQVYESESGHIVEFDDTKDHERIHIRHRSGTRLEITANGDQLAITKGNNYLIIDKDNKVYIQGNSDITVNGNASIRAGQEANVLANTINATATGDINLSASNVNITGDVVLDGKLDVTKDLTVEGKLIVKDGSTLTGSNSIEGYQEI
jgi:cytoskeletal protein CcmA (bactofilin family)